MVRLVPTLLTVLVQSCVICPSTAGFWEGASPRQLGSGKEHHPATLSVPHDSLARKISYLRGGAGFVSNIMIRQGSNIMKETMAAKDIDAVRLPVESSQRGAADDSDEESNISLNTKYASIIAKRKVKMSSIYDVDFAETGVLGTGTFSTVRVATHKDTGVKYAVKAINLTNIQPQTLIRLRREIQVLRSLNHKNIIQLYEIFEEDGMLLMIMELCTGGELWHFLQRVEIFPNGEKFYYSPKGERVALSEGKVVRIIRGIVEAIYYCHSRGVSHRDLKLENLMLSDNENGAEVKLIDFGFSKIFKGMNSMFAVLGSPYYVAPEVLRARPPTKDKAGLGYGCACDMWSIGVITYMILCGQAPFDGETDQERLIAVKRSTFKYPAHAKLSPEATSLINGLLCVDPERRLTARAVLDHPWMQLGRRTGSLPLATRTRGVFGWIGDCVKGLARDVLSCCSVADGLHP